MAVESSRLRELSLSRLFPGVRLFGAAGLAIDARKLVLATLGLIVMWAGWNVLDRAFPASRSIVPSFAGPLAPGGAAGFHPLAEGPRSLPGRLIEPPLAVVGPFAAVFSPRSDWRTFLHAFLAGAWAAAVWGIVGGAICRIAVVQFALGGGVGMREALGFALKRTVALVGGPLSPLLGVAILVAFCALFGLLYRLPPSVGPVVAGILLFLPIGAGLLMTLILAGLALGWPLMHASVAAEAEDGFDALSRSYAYVKQRPLRYAGYVALAWVVGTGGLVVVELFARLVIHLTEWGLSFTAPPPLLESLFGNAPAESATAPALLHAFWRSVVALLVRAWIYSYFWTSFAMVYLLLRHEVDGTPLHQVAFTPRAVSPGEPAPSANDLSVPEEVATPR